MGTPRQDGSGEAISGTRLLEILAELPGNATELALAAWLRTRVPVREARAVQAQVALRRRASARFGEEALVLLTEKGLAQATAPAVARARAERMLAIGGVRSVLDATCGLGSDSIALARAGLGTIAADRDRGVLALARENLRARGVDALVAQMDALAPAARTEWIVLDPDRRAGGRRSLAGEEWSPSLAASLAVAARFAGAAIKLPPALDVESVAGALPSPGGGVRWQWVSHRGELAETCLWLGELEGPGASEEREVLRLDAAGAHALRARPIARDALAPSAALAIAWLADPDPALVRSGLLGALAEREDLRPIAPRCAYLGGARAPTSPLLPAWRVLGAVSLDRRRVRELLARHDVGPIAVRKRGHPDPAETLARRFAGSGRQRGHLAVARLERGHVAYLLADSPPAAG